MNSKDAVSKTNMEITIKEAHELFPLIPMSTLIELYDYVDDRKQPGMFLKFALLNCLIPSVGAASMKELAAIKEIAQLIYNYMPTNCWGTSQAIENHLSKQVGDEGTPSYVDPAGVNELASCAPAGDKMSMDGFRRQVDIIRKNAVNRPEIVCLCGSTRFKDEFIEINKRLTLNGYIVLTVGFFGHVDGMPDAETKAELDELHKRKIDIADIVFVVNKDGYIGKSTFSEIMYATRTGKRVVAMEGGPVEDVKQFLGEEWLRNYR